MKTFYFNTGVKPYGHNPPVGLYEGQVWRGGTKQIPFDCEDVPDNAIFQYGTSNIETLPENHIRREIHNSTLGSKYAIFLIP